jgi:hypothetical protein
MPLGRLSQPKADGADAGLGPGHDCINVRLPIFGRLYAWEYEKGRRELRVLAAWCPPFSCYHLYCPSRCQPTPAFSAGRGAALQRLKGSRQVDSAAWQESQVGLTAAVIR